VVTGKPPATQFQSDLKGSFACSSSQQLNMERNALLLSNLQYRAFGTDNSTSFSVSGTQWILVINAFKWLSNTSDTKQHHSPVNS